MTKLFDLSSFGSEAGTKGAWLKEFDPLLDGEECAPWTQLNRILRPAIGSASNYLSLTSQLITVTRIGEPCGRSRCQSVGSV